MNVHGPAHAVGVVLVVDVLQLQVVVLVEVVVVVDVHETVGGVGLP